MKNETEQPKHTHGEWRVVGNYILSENNEEVAKVITSDVTNERTSEANAQRIVKAVKLLSIIEDEIFELEERDKTEAGEAILEELKELIKQSEQK